MIFGADDRVKIATDYAPYMGAFVQIISTFPDGYSAQGSGSLIGSNDVLTAAHVIYSEEHDGYATSIEVTPAKFGNYEPYGSISANSFTVNSGWINYEDNQYDYGVISLENPVGFETGWLSFDYLSSLSTTIDNTSFISYGYPGDKNSGNWLYSTSGTPDDSYSNILLFTDDLDTYFGQSGSPVIAITEESDTITGLVSFQTEDPDANGVVTLTQIATMNISSWISQNDDTLLTSTILTVSLPDHISALYIAFFNRAPDKEGFDFWQTQGEVDDIAQLFANHEVFTSKYSLMDNQSFIQAIYTNILGNEGDEEGISYWASLLDSGYTRSAVVDGFVTSTLSASLQSQDFAYLSYTQYADALYRQETLANKIEVSHSFVDILGSNTNIQDTLDPQNDPAYLASQNILLNVTDDESITQDVISYLSSISQSTTPIEDINTSAQTIGISTLSLESIV